LTIAVVLMSAAVLKLSGGHAAQTMSGSLPGWLQICLVSAELLLATWLLTGLAPRLAGLVTIILLSTFFGAILLEMLKEHPQPCGCFGAVYVAANDPVIIKRTLAISLAVDSLLMLGALVVVLLPARRGHVAVSVTN
jgi:hypothetical protein